MLMVLKNLISYQFELEDFFFLNNFFFFTKSFLKVKILTRFEDFSR